MDDQVFEFNTMTGKTTALFTICFAICVAVSWILFEQLNIHTNRSINVLMATLQIGIGLLLMKLFALNVRLTVNKEKLTIFQESIFEERQEQHDLTELKGFFAPGNESGGVYLQFEFPEKRILFIGTLLHVKEDGVKCRQFVGYFITHLKYDIDTQQKRNFIHRISRIGFYSKKKCINKRNKKRI